jgi:L-fuconolactonase
MIVDAQVHVWAADRPDRPWPRDRRLAAPHGEPIGAAELRAMMAAAGVDRVVLVPPNWEGYRNDLALEGARRWPGQFTVMGRFDFTDPGWPRQVADWPQRKLSGYRVSFGAPADLAALSNGQADVLWDLAQRLQIPLTVYPPANGLIEDIASRYPDLRVIVDHLGLRAKIDEAGPEIDALAKLARFPNVAVKASGLPAVATDEYPYASVHETVYQLVDSFGAERVFWGSDITRLPCTYRQAVTVFTEELTRLDEAQLKQVMGEAILAWLNWD